MLYFTTEIHLPSLIRREIIETCEALLGRTKGLLQIHCARAEDRVRCDLRLMTYEGTFDASAQDYDIRDAVQNACDSLERKFTGVSQAASAA